MAFILKIVTKDLQASTNDTIALYIVTNHIRDLAMLGHPPLGKKCLEGLQD